MKSDRDFSRARSLPTLLRHLCLLGVFAVGVARAWPRDESGSSWVVVSFLAGAAEWLSPGLIAGAFFFDWLSKTIRGQGKWSKVRKALDFLQSEIFELENKEGDPVDENRVTLFRKQWLHVRWRYYCWPRFQFEVLVAVERSGDQTRESDVTFHAPDDGKRNLGVAGQAWRKAVELYVDNLPDVSGDAPAKADVREYAERTFTSQDRVKTRKPSARSFVAFPLWVDSKKWGTIVIDSRRPTRRDSAHEKKLYRAAHFVLSSYLSKGDKP